MLVNVCIYSFIAFVFAFIAGIFRSRTVSVIKSYKTDVPLEYKKKHKKRTRNEKKVKL